MVVANSALVPVCLRVLVLAMQPPPAPPKPEEEGAVPRDAWQPASGVVEIQSEVIAALDKVGFTSSKLADRWHGALCQSAVLYHGVNAGHLGRQRVFTVLGGISIKVYAHSKAACRHNSGRLKCRQLIDA